MSKPQLFPTMQLTIASVFLTPYSVNSALQYIECSVRYPVVFWLHGPTALHLSGVSAATAFSPFAQSALAAALFLSPILVLGAKPQQFYSIFPRNFGSTTLWFHGSIRQGSE